MKDKLLSLPMDDLRLVGYDLEPLVGHEVRNSVKLRLAELIMDVVMAEGDAAIAVVNEHLQRAAPADAPAEAVEAPAATDADRVDAAVRKADQAAPVAAEPKERPGSPPKRKLKPTAADTLPDHTVGPFLIVQCHPGNVLQGVYYRDLVVNPVAEVKSIILNRLVYSTIGLGEAQELLRVRRLRVNQIHSRIVIDAPEEND